jgi:thiamine biosynthesis protein ThiS
MKSKMRIQLNGEPKEIATVPTLSDLVAALGMKADRIAVELNHQIVSRAQWAETPVREGDKLEIVHFVGGGV